MSTEFSNNLKELFIEKKSKELKIEKLVLNTLIELANNDLDKFKKIYEYIFIKRNYKNIELNLSIEFLKDIVKMKINNIISEISFDNLNCLFVNIIDLIEPIYPLGTVVNLKTEYLNNLLDDNKISVATFVIINRFVYTDNIKTYFQYTGIPYPVGSLGFSRNLYFTSELIDEVVHLGHSDDKENAFIYMMKKELILDKNYCSIGYASKDDRDKLNSLLKEVKYIGE